jgi:hypothetical protein
MSITGRQRRKLEVASRESGVRSQESEELPHRPLEEQELLTTSVAGTSKEGPLITHQCLSQRFVKNAFLMRAGFSKPREGRHRVAQGARRCEKITKPVIPSEARNLHLFVFKEINADASLRAYDFFKLFHRYFTLQAKFSLASSLIDDMMFVWITLLI